MNMKTNLFKINKKFVFVILALLLTNLIFSQNYDLKISDNSNFVISPNTYLKVSGDLTLGSGTSGLMEMNGISLTVDGNFNINANSDFKISQGLFTAGSTVFNESSTFTYEGNSQTVNNLDYGILAFSGTGNMLIDGNAVTPTTCKSLIVNSTGNSLIIPETKAITVDNTVENYAGTLGIIVKSSALGDGSLISGTLDCDATVERYIKGNRWHYLSPSISSAPLNIFNTNNFLWWDASMQWLGVGDWSPWKAYDSEYLNIGEGYAYYFYEDTIQFSGKLNVSDYTVTLYKNALGNSDYQGWNLVGNPYSSVLDWDAAVTDGAVPVGAENAIYFFDDENASGEQSNYRYYVPSTGGTYGVGTNNANGKIPMGQGFFIKTNTDNVTLSLKKNYRVHDSQEFYKNFNDELIRIQLMREITDETVLRVVSDATNNFDPEYDARKLFIDNDLIPNIYFIESDKKYAAISSVPEISENSVFKLGLKAEEGICSILIDELNVYQENAYLLDNVLNIYHKINDKQPYEFFHKGGTDNNRFFIVFNKTSSDIVNISNSNISVFPNPTTGILYFENEDNLSYKTIRVNTIDGRTCLLKNNLEKLIKLNLSNLNAGIYFLEVILEDNSIYTEKIIINK